MLLPEQATFWTQWHEYHSNVCEYKVFYMNLYITGCYTDVVVSGKAISQAAADKRSARLLTAAVSEASRRTGKMITQGVVDDDSWQKNEPTLFTLTWHGCDVKECVSGIHTRLAVTCKYFFLGNVLQSFVLRLVACVYVVFSGVEWFFNWKKLVRLLCCFILDIRSTGFSTDSVTECW